MPAARSRERRARGNAGTELAGEGLGGESPGWLREWRLGHAVRGPGSHHSSHLGMRHCLHGMHTSLGQLAPGGRVEHRGGPCLQPCCCEPGRTMQHRVPQSLQARNGRGRERGKQAKQAGARKKGGQCLKSPSPVMPRGGTTSPPIWLAAAKECMPPTGAGQHATSHIASAGGREAADCTSTPRLSSTCAGAPNQSTGGIIITSSVSTAGHTRPLAIRPSSWMAPPPATAYVDPPGRPIITRWPLVKRHAMARTHTIMFHDSGSPAGDHLPGNDDTCPVPGSHRHLARHFYTHGST